MHKLGSLLWVVATLASIVLATAVGLQNFQWAQMPWLIATAQVTKLPWVLEAISIVMFLSLFLSIDSYTKFQGFITALMGFLLGTVVQTVVLQGVGRVLEGFNWTSGTFLGAVLLNLLLLWSEISKFAEASDKK